MYSPEENYSHVKQEKFSSLSNCESKPKILLNKHKRNLELMPYELNELEQIFDKNKNQVPNIYIRKNLAKKMGMSEIKIRNWFKYKVMTWKRKSGCKSESKSLLNQRKRFKSHELIELKRIFEKNHNPDKNIRNDLAQRLGVSEFRIYNWFRKTRLELNKNVPSTSAGDGYVDVITSSTGDVNYPLPPAPVYSQAETMSPDHPHPQLPQFQIWPDFFATFSAMFSATFSAVQYLSHHVLLTQQRTDSDDDHSEPLDLRLTASHLQ